MSPFLTHERRKNLLLLVNFSGGNTWLNKRNSKGDELMKRLAVDQWGKEIFSRSDFFYALGEQNSNNRGSTAWSLRVALS